jgi:hypothetical protein
MSNAQNSCANMYEVLKMYKSKEEVSYNSLYNYLLK